MKYAYTIGPETPESLELFEKIKANKKQCRKVAKIFNKYWSKMSAAGMIPTTTQRFRAFSQVVTSAADLKESALLQWKIVQTARSYNDLTNK